ncbi:MAG: hypothetical protein PHH44_08490 [bacterium]|nr:hypothetical protein [bacterium]
MKLSIIIPAYNEENTIVESYNGLTRQRFMEINNLPRLEADKVFKKEAWDFIKNNPKTVVWLWYKRFFHFWRLYPLIATPANKIAAFLTSGSVIILGWLGFIITIRNWRKTILFLFLLGTYTVVHVVSLTNIRYRVPIDTFMMVFAAYTIWWFYQWMSGRYNRLKEGGQR